MLPDQGWNPQHTNLDTVFVPLPEPYVGVYYEGEVNYIYYANISPLGDVKFDGSVLVQLVTGRSATLWGFACIATIIGAYHAFLLDSIQPQKVPSGYDVQPCVHNTVASVEACPDDLVLVQETYQGITLVNEASITPSYTDE